jgi:photosystem II stability/assembly factor-like uncharacterized protein
MKYRITSLLLLVLVTSAFSQKNKKQPTPATPPAGAVVAPAAPNPQDLGLEWRCVGPFRGGRSAAVTGVKGQPDLFYFGGTGGGVWRTQDAGKSWDCISDGFFGGSIGAVEVAPSDPNVLYVGGGEVTVRGNVSSGNGVWKSEDAGRTWKQMGLSGSRHIPRLRIHPTNHEVVYAAVLGDIYQPSAERGVYRTRDGGRTWQRVLFVNDEVGAVDLCLDPTNPRILYASTWRVRRTPHSLSSGGSGSGLWKSTDGGDTWTQLTQNQGLPTDTLGIIGVAVSPARPDRVWAIIESQTGGVFRSDDGGKTWAKTNEDRSLRQRAWYYTRIYADPADADVVYVLNVSYHKSTDGGKTFKAKNAPHGDHHDLWIAPENPDRMVMADDGGAQISLDGGDSWSTYHNQPTAQFYRVSTDNSFPFRILAAQQDNTSVRLEHRSDGGGIAPLQATAGGESGHIVADPRNPDVVYGGEYHGYLTRMDHKNNTTRAVNVWPEDNMGHGAEDAKYRFQWNFPLFFSPHDPRKLYAASNHLHVTTNEGQSWETRSPDLTTNDRARQRSSGGPITQDNTSVEYYCTIFAAAESPRVADLLWTGSDDGLVHLSRDGGKNWKNVTPPDLPKWTQINAIEADPHRDGGCYLAATSYKSGDYRPYIFKTEDYGATWKKITQGIENEDFVRVVRADLQQKNLLYAGTEQGMYLSTDGGNVWKKWQLNLPIVPITDLTLRDNKLIAATQGRSIWMIDDLVPLQAFVAASPSSDREILYPAGAAYRTKGYAPKGSKTTGENHPNGVLLHFWLAQKPAERDTVTLTFFDEKNQKIKTFSTVANGKSPEVDALKNLKKGGNRFVWDLRYPNAEKFEGMVLWSYDLEGPKVVPGRYRAELQAAGVTQSIDFEVLADPRSPASAADFRAQLDFVNGIGAKLTTMHRTIRDIRALRGQFDFLKEKMGNDAQFKPLRDLLATTDSTMTSVEKAFYQTQNRSSQDPLNFPVRLNDKLANLMGLNAQDDFPPTAQSIAVRDKLFAEVDAELAKWEIVRTQNLPEINRLVRALGVDVIQVKR